MPPLFSPHTDAEILTGTDPKAANSFAQPDLLKAVPFAAIARADGQRCQLPPLSFAALTLNLR